MRIIDWSSDVCSSDLLRDHSESESRYAEPSKRSKGTRPKDSHALSWTLTDRTPARLELVWRERGGPPVLPPERAGFGTRMLAGAGAGTSRNGSPGVPAGRPGLRHLGSPAVGAGRVSGWRSEEHTSELQ